jgi:ABC-type transport system involved in multi-copper enzyme maturation permease subunit
MISLWTIWTVARYETKVLLRSWAFRIFLILSLFVLVIMNIAFASPVANTPYFLSAVSGFLPLMNTKLLNLFQAVIIAFLACDFLKRDRRHDSTEVVYTRSMTNADYIIGKVVGILGLFFILDLIVLVIGLLFHLLLSTRPFALEPYILYPLLVSLPTLIFMIGAALILMNIVRVQAIVFVLLIAFSFLSMTYLGRHFFNLADMFAYYQPLVYSDFIGLGNAHELLLLRGAYLLFGIALICAAVLLMKRLNQSRVTNIVVAIVGVVSLALSVSFAVAHVDDGYTARDYRESLRGLSKQVVNVPTAGVTNCDLRINGYDGALDAEADLIVRNNTPEPLDSLLFSLNPGLGIISVQGDGVSSFRRDEHLLWLRLDSQLLPDSTRAIKIAYKGDIDQRYCYLDLPDSRLEGEFRIWMYAIPKTYAVVSKDYLLLTPECGFYPIAGLSNACAFPAPGSNDFVNFKLSIDIPPGEIAISQGSRSVEEKSGAKSYSFQSDVPLPQISVIVGPYTEHSVNVDSVDYALYNLPSHDYYMPFFDQVGDTLPSLIREIKTKYEMGLGLSYQYRKLELVEVPIQFYSYKREWTLAQEVVQPQDVLLQEMGAICAATDFARLSRMSTRRQERANQADAPEVTQANHFTAFIRSDILGTSPIRVNPGDLDNLDPVFHITPNYSNYMLHLNSKRWPILEYALESYIANRVASTDEGFGVRFGGLTTGERANLAAGKLSLAQLLAGDRYPDLRYSILESKGSQLLLSWAAAIGVQRFEQRLLSFFRDNRYKNISADDLFAALAPDSGLNLAQWIDTWYNETRVPGYLMKDIKGYNVLSGNRVRTQIKFTLANPEPVAGVVRAAFRGRRQRERFQPRWMRASDEEEETRTFYVPPESEMQIALLLDDAPAMMVFDTYVSQNIPSVMNERFMELELDRDKTPSDTDVVLPYNEENFRKEGEYIVDNEDPGFEVASGTEQNLLRRFLTGLSESDQEDDVPYIGLYFWSPPGSWKPTIDGNFYGKYIHSGYYKKTGDGTQRVAWNVNLPESDDYDIYYYVEQMNMPVFVRGRRGGPGAAGRADRGEKHFWVHHEDGEDEVVLDLNLTEPGWNLLGTFRLRAGQNRVELTDQGTTSFVTADAVKWVRH